MLQKIQTDQNSTMPFHKAFNHLKGGNGRNKSLKLVCLLTGYDILIGKQLLLGMESCHPVA